MHARHSLTQGLGALLTWERTPHSLLLQAENGFVELSPTRHIGLRIRAGRQWHPPGHSYAVVAELEPEAFALDETESALRLLTEHLEIRITKSPYSLQIFDRQGRLLHADDPTLALRFQGERIGHYRQLQPYERFFGLGEKTGHADRWGKAYTQWNTDFFGYGIDSDPIYASIPFFLGAHGGVLYGWFYDSPARSTFNFGASNRRFAAWTAETGDLDAWFFSGTHVADILKAYTRLTGRSPMPPRWALGLQQCRYSYYPAQKLIHLAESYRYKGIPADVLYLDIHYTQDFKMFTWHGQHFREPQALLARLRDMGFRVVIIHDPGIKVELGYAPYDSGTEQDAFLKYPDGAPYEAQVWPGWCVFPDFTKPSTRTWWGQLMQDCHRYGVSGFWNDMNEIASWGQSTPEVVEFDYEGEKASHLMARNVYGMQMARASREGSDLARGEERSFILTRAAYAGIQRYSAVWTGDNTASDEHMLLGIRMLNSLGLSGVPFVGTDIGGFIGECSPELFARWFQVAAFHPLMRVHKMIDTRDSEPWTYGERVEVISRNYAQLRYRLMPYLYTLFYHAHQWGLPVMRSLALEHPHAPQTWDHRYENQFLLGPFLLVAPLTSLECYAKVWLPPSQAPYETWYQLFTDQTHPAGQEVLVEAPLEQLPVFVQAGAIVPEQSLVQHSDQEHDGILRLHLYKGEHPSEFLFYEDDGNTRAHESGDYARRVFQLHSFQRKLSASAQEGSFASSYRRVRLLFHGFGSIHRIQAGEQELKPRLVYHTWLEATPSFDPLGAAHTGYSVPVWEVEIDYSAHEWHVLWN